MKKLRLIKPWGLRTVRMKLENGRYSGAESVSFIPCCGPVADDACLSNDIRLNDMELSPRFHNEETRRMTEGPLSDVTWRHKAAPVRL